MNKNMQMNNLAMLFDNITGPLGNPVSDEDVSNYRGIKFRLTDRFASNDAMDVEITYKNKTLELSKSEYAAINGIYLRKGIINGQLYWFKRAKHTYDEELGYHIYMADVAQNRWVISNGRCVIYEYCGKYI